MKKIFIPILILLLISVGFNIKFIKNDLYKKTVFLNQLNSIVSYFITDNKIKILPLYTDNISNIQVLVARYEKNTPANWHIHTNGQIMYVTGGEGFYQEENQNAKHIKAGDVIKTKPNVLSWHGSVKNNYLEVVVINYGKGDSIKWLKPVDKTYYDNLKVED